MNEIKRYAFHIWGSHSSNREGSSPLGCYGKYLLTFRRIVTSLWDPIRPVPLKLQFLIIFEHMWSTHSTWFLQSAALVSSSDMCVCLCVCVCMSVRVYVCAPFRSSCIELRSVYTGSSNMSIFSNSSHLSDGLTCQRTFPVGTCSKETSVCLANM